MRPYPAGYGIRDTGIRDTRVNGLRDTGTGIPRDTGYGIPEYGIRDPGIPGYGIQVRVSRGIRDTGIRDTGYRDTGYGIPEYGIQDTGISGYRDTGGRDVAILRLPPQLRCTGNGEPPRGSRGLIYHAEARRFPCSSASCCASSTMGWRTTTIPMAVPAHLRAGSGLRSLRLLAAEPASRTPSVPQAAFAEHGPRWTGSTTASTLGG